jgi:type IV pilus assembly protein PilQ
MITRRLVVTLALVALVSNCVVLAKPNFSSARPSGAQAFTLMSLRHETVSGLNRILIESNSPPLYTVFRPTDRLIQVDLPGGEGSQLAPEYAVKSDLIDSIQVHKGRSGGQSLRAATRIEIAVEQGVTDRSRVEGNTLVIELASDPGVAKNPVKADSPSNQQSSEKQGVYVHPVPVSSKTAKSTPAPEPSAPTRAATVVSSVRHESSGDSVRIYVDTDGAAQFKDFVLNNPWRIVIDITGVRLSAGNKTVSVGSALVERLRVGQPAANVVRLVLDTATKVPYRVERVGTQLVIVVGNQTSSNIVKPASESDSKEVAQKTVESKPEAEVKVAGDRVINQQNSQTESSSKTALPSTEIAQAAKSNATQPAKRGPVTSQPASRGAVKESVVQPVSQPAGKTVAELQRGNQPVAMTPSTPPPSSRPTSSYQTQNVRSEKAFCDPDFVGGPISFDLRAGVDLRDMLRFVSQQYGVNFIVDKSVTSVPVDIRVTDIPWNQVIEAVLRANRLGAVCESGGRLIRIATLAAVKEEEEARAAIAATKEAQKPLETKVLRLRYARATGTLGGNSSRSGGGGGASSGGGGGQSTGNLLSIAKARLSKRGNIEVDGRTNTLIIIDLPENVRAVESIIAQLDKPEPQVEIEARIVIATRNFLRDVGNELAAAARDINRGKGGLLATSPVTVGDNGGVASGGNTTGGTGLGPNLIGPVANGALRGTANTVLSLTTGLIGTSIISSALSLSETKGQIRTIASPRITAQDQQTAEIVNGIQIPVQTVSNNTVTTTFVTAALRLEITPQIIEETGEVLMRVVAENNTVNTALANAGNGGTPGINTQAAQSIVRVQDGGTTVMGGINIDSEGHSMSRTPGVSSIPLFGELFKRRTTRRDYDEILFFITPRIVRNDGQIGPNLRRSSVDGVQSTPSAPQRAAVTPSTNENNNKKAEQSTQPTTAPSGKGGGK